MALFNGKSTIAMAIFNSYVSHYQRVTKMQPPSAASTSERPSTSQHRCLLHAGLPRAVPAGDKFRQPKNWYNNNIYWYCAYNIIYIYIYTVAFII